MYCVQRKQQLLIIQSRTMYYHLKAEKFVVSFVAAEILYHIHRVREHC
jgi:hypothetical protein